MGKVLSVWLIVVSSLLAVSNTLRCFDDSIAGVSHDGSEIRMRSGTLWAIDDRDQEKAVLWLKGEDVSVCSDAGGSAGKTHTEYTIVNPTLDNESLTARLLY